MMMFKGVSAFAVSLRWSHGSIKTKRKNETRERRRERDTKIQID